MELPNVPGYAAWWQRLTMSIDGQYTKQQNHSLSHYKATISLQMSFSSFL